MATCPVIRPFVSTFVDNLNHPCRTRESLNGRCGSASHHTVLTGRAPTTEQMHDRSQLRTPVSGNPLNQDMMHTCCSLLVPAPNRLDPHRKLTESSPTMHPCLELPAGRSPDVTVVAMATRLTGAYSRIGTSCCCLPLDGADFWTSRDFSWS